MGTRHAAGSVVKPSGRPAGADLRSSWSLGQSTGLMPSGIEVWSAGGKDYFAVRVGPHGRRPDDWLRCRGVPPHEPEFSDAHYRNQSETREYNGEQDYRALKQQMLLFFYYLHRAAAFLGDGIALFLAKQVTIPIQALAEGTREISAGNFDYQVPEQAQDELGVLVRSFNTMTTQLRDNRSQIDQFTRNLQQAVKELERRRQLMETVLENIPTKGHLARCERRYSPCQIRQ